MAGAVAFVVGHAVLGLVASQVRAVASIHVVIVTLVAIVVACTSRRVDRILAVAAYCATCDVFWRMTKSIMPWEGAKYLSMAVMLVAFFRFVAHPKNVRAPLLYFLLLLPGAVWSVIVLGPTVSRGLVSANLAGPALLFVGVMFIRQLIGTDREVSIVLWAMLGPIAACAAISTYATVASNTLSFTDNSNFDTSGGFGPVQVSTLLGLGALICILLSLTKVPVLLLMLQIALAGWFAAQSALTFSRGGLYSLAVGCIAIIIAALTTRGFRSRAITGLAIGFLVVVALYPSLNSFTDGALETRFSDTNSTNRDTIASADLDLFVSSPLFGIGMGVAKFERGNTETAFDVEAKAHTEYTRMLAEHGAFGLVSLFLLVVMVVQCLRRATTRWNRLLAAGFAFWSLTSMAHSATSIAAITFIFALAQIRLVRTPHP